MMKVHEIMTRDVVSVLPQMPALKALDLLLERKISGLPVLTEDRTLVGMFTEKDILSYILPSYVSQVGNFVYQDDPKAVHRKFAQLSQALVADVSRKEVVTVTETTGVVEAIHVMLARKARRLPVLDAQGKVSGIVSRADLLRALINPLR
jgi:CBS domain-containing protein